MFVKSNAVMVFKTKLGREQRSKNAVIDDHSVATWVECGGCGWFSGEDGSLTVVNGC